MQDKARLTERIKKLPALAGADPDEAEAASALNKAYILMRANNLTLDEVLGGACAKKAKPNAQVGDAARERKAHRDGADHGRGQDSAGQGENEPGAEAGKESGYGFKWFAPAVLSSVLTVAAGPSLPGILMLALLIISRILWVPGLIFPLVVINGIFKAVFKKSLL